MKDQTPAQDESIAAFAGRLCGKLLVLAVCVWIFVYMVTWDDAHSPHNPTDPAVGRSGMRLYRDTGTGCEYLAPLFGGLTPRMDSTGKQMCAPSLPAAN